MQRRPFLLSTAALLAAPALPAQSPWAAIEQVARGQTVVFNAWGGSEGINSYLQWAASEPKAVQGVTLTHVKLADTAEFVRRVRAEKAAGRRDGSADLVWINGENFLAMKREALLYGPWAGQLPNFAFVDVAGKPTTQIDFAEPVQGMEAPWGMAQLTFYVDTARAPRPAPASLAGLLAWATRHPGRFSDPRPPQFIGSSLLKQALTELNADRGAPARPHTHEAFARLAPPQALLLDEPFSRLDRALRERMRAFTWAALRRHAVPAVLVTHDPQDLPPAAAVLALDRHV
jgi:putative thiamine transport system substrate-binding protein